MKMNTAQRAVFCLREHDDHLLSQCHFSVEKPPLIYKLSRLRDHFGCTVSCEPGVAQIFIPAGAPLRLGADRAPHQPWPAIAARAHTSPRATHPTDPPRATMSLADNATWNAVKPFLNGGLSGMGATCIIQPLDIIKVRPSAIPPRRLAAPIRSRGVRRLGRARGLGRARVPRELAPGVRPATESAPPNAAALPPRRGTSSRRSPPTANQPTPARRIFPLTAFGTLGRLPPLPLAGPPPARLHRRPLRGRQRHHQERGLRRALHGARARERRPDDTHTPPARRVGPVLPGRNEASAEATHG